MGKEDLCLSHFLMQKPIMELTNNKTTIMRMSGAIGFNPLFGKSNFPVKIRAYFVFALSLLLYLSADQTQMAYPGSMAEYILMLA